MRKLVCSLVATIVLASPVQAAERPKQIGITYVTSPFNVPSIVMNKKGYLEEAFKPLDIAVTSPEITSGAKQVQALAAGEVQIASVLGGASAILGRANGADIKIIAVYSRSPKAYAIMTRADGPADIAALKGKKIAGPKGTTLHQLLAAALVRNGMALKDVEHINMDLPTARAALLAGNNALAVEQEKGRILADGEGLIAPTTVIGVRTDLLDNHPDIVRAYLSAHQKALDFIRDNQQEALELVAAEQKISLDDARRMFAWYDFSLRLTEQDVLNLNADQDFMIEADMLRNRTDIKNELIAPIAFELK